MAAVLKATKVVNLGDSPFVTGSYFMRVDYTNPSTVPPTPGSVNFHVTYAQAEDPTAIQAECDDQLTLLGGNTVDWTI